jgi:hypothetical protein
MAEKSGFFNAKLVSGSYDRTYQAEDFADCLSLFIPNGIYVEDSETLTGTIDKTTVQGLKPYSSGTSLFIKEGKAFINGYWYVLDEQDLEISLTVNTAKAIALMYVAADRRMRVELLDLVDGQPNVPKTDAQYGILLGTVSYTSDGVSVTDLRTEFMLGSPQTNHIMSLKTQRNLRAYEDKINEQDIKIKGIKDRFIICKGETKGVKFGESKDVFIHIKKESLGSKFNLGNARDWFPIFCGQDQQSYYEDDPTNVDEKYTGQYNLMVSSATAGMDKSQIISNTTPFVKDIIIDNNRTMISVYCSIESVGINFDLEEKNDIKFVIVLMRIN